MTASALTLAFPTQPQAAGSAAAAAPTGAAGAFEALLGAMFGTQSGIAAELFAGAAPAGKTESTEPAAEGEAVDGDADTSILAMAMAGAMAMPPAPPLVAGLPAQSAGAETPATPAPVPQPQAADAVPNALEGETPAPGAAAKAQPLPPVTTTRVPAARVEPAPEPLTPPVQQAEAASAAATLEASEPAAPPSAPSAAPARHRSAATEVAQTAQPAAAAAPGQAVQPIQPQAETQARAALGVDAVDAAPVAARGEETSDLPAPEIDAPAPAHAPKAETASDQAPVAVAATPVRGSPETVAQLAANIVKKLEGRSTRFDLELEPLGLGRVDVRVEIGAHGRLTAALSFDNPQAQAELRSRANELTRALEQAGFDLSGGLSFDVADQRGQQNQAQGDQNQAGAAWRGRAFQAALDQAGDAVEAAVSGALNLQRRWNAGVDIRI